MAPAITAPTVTVPGLGPSVVVGKPFVVTGTGWAATHAFTVTIEQMGVQVLGTTDGSGNLTTSALVVLTPQSDVPLDISVSDGTSTLNIHVEVGTE